MQAAIHQAKGDAAVIRERAKATAEGIELISSAIAGSPGGHQAANLRVAEQWVAAWKEWRYVKMDFGAGKGDVWVEGGGSCCEEFWFFVVEDHDLDFVWFCVLRPGNVETQVDMDGIAIFDHSQLVST